MRRTLVGGLVVGMVLTLAVAVPAAQASSTAQSTSCNLNTVVRFDPGLNGTQRSQLIKARGKLTACNGGGVTSATMRGKGSGSLSCTSGTASLKLRVTWNTTEISVIKLTVDLSNQTLSGFVKSGKFAGEDVTVNNASFTPIDGDCFFTPVTKARVTGTAGI